MGPVELAAQIMAGHLPNVPPEWWPQVREIIDEADEKAYWAALRAEYLKRRKRRQSLALS